MWAVCLIGTALIIAYTDITQRRIDNKLILAVAILSIALNGFAQFNPVYYFIAVIIGLLLFGFGIFAGGDIKLMLAFLPAINTEHWPVILMLVAVTGGIIAAGYLIYGLIAGRIQEVRKRGLPYGVPIAFAGCVGVLLSSA